MEGLRQDFQYAARTLLRTPGFALTAALTLGLGIGVSVAMFSVLDGILLRPLPYEDPDRLVMLWINDPKHGVTEEGFGFPTNEDWRAMNPVFDDIAACIRDNHFLVERDGETERSLVSLATHNLFSLLGVAPVTTLESLVEDHLSTERFLATLSSVFGLLAVLLASVGLYGVTAYAVTRRTNEIGIRMALGARRRSVLWMILRESLSQVALGAAIGVPLAFATTRFIASQLYGVNSNVLATVITAALVLVAVGALASYLPARRAARVDPMVALRYE